MAINFRRFFEGLNLVPKAASTVDSAGDLDFDTSSNKVNLHNGTTSSPVVTEAHTATLTNKTIDGDNNTVQDLGLTTLKTVLADANKVLQRDASGIVVSGPTVPSGSGGFVRTDSTDTLTNKTIAAGSNTITGLTNTNLSGSAGITGANIASNTVANSNLSNMATQTIKGRTTAGTGAPEDLTATQATAILNNYVGDSGSGGTKGLVPAPASGDAAANKFLKADGAWTALPTTAITSLTGDVTAAGPGAAAATVAFVAASSAANVHAAELLANAATNANTASAIVKRDGSGNFSAGSITAVTSVKTPSLTDNGAGLNIQPTANQNVTIATTSAGRVIINSAEGLDMGEQSGSPANPSAGYSNLFFKTDHLLYRKDSSGNESLVGSGGAGGVNFLTLDTTFVPTKTDNFNAESTVGDWVAYADAAGSTPVDMTGGSPVVTIARTTTAGEVLDGLGGFKVVKDAANRQGNGVSCVANIPVGYRGQQVSISAPFKILSGSLVSGDIKFYVYDVTNSQIIAPFNNDVLLSPSLLTMYFNVPATCAQVRVGFHFASTSTTAVTFAFDDISVGPFQVAFGPAMTDWKNDLTFTPVAGGFGTVTLSNFWYRRVGDTMQVKGSFKAGTVGATNASIALPTGYTIDSAKFSTATNQQHVGYSHRTPNAAGPLSVFNSGGAGAAIHPWFYDGSDTSNIYLARGMGSNQFQKIATSGDISSNDSLSIEFSFPVTGWSTNVSSNNSQVFNIAGLLASGTRVTGSAPTALGQYRSYLKTGTFTYSETNGSPTTAPTSTNGIVLYGGGIAAGSADTNNQPSRYEIFVGKNKTVRPQFFLSTGRTGYIDTDPIDTNGDANIMGYFTNYDPTTGIFNIVPNIASGGGTHYVGVDGNSQISAAGNIYFDLIVSENALAVQSSPNRSEVYLDTGNGVGGSVSGETFVRNFTNVKSSIGSAITYVPRTTTTADKFVINENGIYYIFITDLSTSAAASPGIIVNYSGSLSAGWSSGTGYANGLRGGTNYGSANTVITLSNTLYLNAGDVVRILCDNTSGLSSNAVHQQFHILKVNN